MANSLRDEMKDSFRNYLADCITGIAYPSAFSSEDAIDEAVCDLADIAFDVVGIESKEQDMPYWKGE